MFIKSRDVTHPVLLYLHGGLPDYFLDHQYPTGLDEYFTVVWWEQRGAGLSYSPDIPPETMTAEQFIADTVAVTNYLRRAFRQREDLSHGAFGRKLLRNTGGCADAAALPGLYRRGTDRRPARIGAARV